MAILVTGAAGFIGSSLCDELLRRNEEVIGVDNFDDVYARSIKEANLQNCCRNGKFKLYEADLADIAALDKVFADNRINKVVHLAARAGVRPSIERPLDYCQTNVTGSMNILETMRRHGVGKLVFASSSSVYGNCPAAIFSEDLKVTEPISPYAASKSAMEQFIYTYSKLFGIAAVCLRFFTVYGPRQRPDLAIHKFTRLIDEGKPIPFFGDGTTKRDYTYIDDIVSGVCAAIAYEHTPYEIINIGGGEPVNLMRMVEAIEKNLGKRAIIERLPMQQGDVNKTVADISKAGRLLGYKPHTNFEEGIRKFVAWYLTQKKVMDDEKTAVNREIEGSAVFNSVMV